MEEVNTIILSIEKKEKIDEDNVKYITFDYKFDNNKVVQSIFNIDIKNDNNMKLLKEDIKTMLPNEMIDDIHIKCKNDRYNMLYDRQTPIDKYLIVTNPELVKKNLNEYLKQILDKWIGNKNQEQNLSKQQETIIVPEDKVRSTSGFNKKEQLISRSDFNQQEQLVQAGGFNFNTLPNLNSIELEKHKKIQVLADLSSRIYINDPTIPQPTTCNYENHNYRLIFDNEKAEYKVPENIYYNRSDSTNVVRLQIYKSDTYIDGILRTNVNDFIIVLRGTKTINDVLSDLGIYTIIEKSIRISQEKGLNKITTEALLLSVKTQLKDYIQQQIISNRILNNDYDGIKTTIDGNNTGAYVQATGALLGSVAAYAGTALLQYELTKAAREDPRINRHEINTTIGNVKKSISSAIIDVPLDMFKKNLEYVKNILDRIYKNYGSVLSPKITLCGHSLAGGIVNFLGNKFKMTNYSFNPIGLKFVDTIDLGDLILISPKVLTNFFVGLIPFMNTFDTTVIRNKYDLVSSINPYINEHSHYGKIYNCNLDYWINKLDLPSIVEIYDVAPPASVGQSLLSAGKNFFTNVGHFAFGVAAGAASDNPLIMADYTHLGGNLQKCKKIIVINHSIKNLQNYISLTYYLRLYAKKNGIVFPADNIINLDFIGNIRKFTQLEFNPDTIKIQYESHNKFNKLVRILDSLETDPITDDHREIVRDFILSLVPIPASIDGAIGGYINQDKYYKKYLKYKQKYMLLKNKI